MGSVRFGAFACAVLVLTGCPDKGGIAEKPAPAHATIAADSSDTSAAGASASGHVALSLDVPPIDADVVRGDTYAVTLAGTWHAPVGTAVFLQAADSAGSFTVPAPSAAPKLSSYRISLPLPTTTAVGTYSGTISVRACADVQCLQPYADTLHTVGYTVRVGALGHWETLQRNARHDGYVPVKVEPSKLRAAWVWQHPSGSTLSGVVTSAGRVFVADFASQGSVFAIRSSDGGTQWRHQFNLSYGYMNPITVSGGVVYVPTTGHEDTHLHALRSSDGIKSWQSAFATQWGRILNPTVSNGRIFVNAGYYSGQLYSFNSTGGPFAWSTSAGSYGANTPAADGDLVYVHNGSTLTVHDAATGASTASIGPSSAGVYGEYQGTPMLGAADSVTAFNGLGNYSSMPNRQLINYSVVAGDVRWMSLGVYAAYPAVARGVVYAASNETRTLDAIDEATGQQLWSWKLPESYGAFKGNVVVTENLAFVSSNTTVYAIDLRHRRTVWRVADAGLLAISGDRQLLVSGGPGYGTTRVAAYRFD